MRPSIILKESLRILLPLMLINAVMIFLRGHNLPGGGFIGGLVAASAFALKAFSDGTRATRKMLILDPMDWAAIGLLISLTSLLIPVFLGGTLMEGTWMKNELPVVGKLGTPVMFDLGVMILVVGMVLQVIFRLKER